MGENYLTVHEAGDVTDEITDMAVEIVDGWYGTGRIDWGDVLDRLDGSEVKDGRLIDLGQDMNSPAIRKIMRTVRKARSENGDMQ